MINASFTLAAMKSLVDAVKYSNARIGVVRIAATVGEMMLARSGIGNLITASASHFDMTGVYTGLFVLMALGGILSDLANRLEIRLLRWRPL